MNDKSPRQQMSKKSVKSIKQKRADRRSKGADAPVATVQARKTSGR